MANRKPGSIRIGKRKLLLPASPVLRQVLGVLFVLGGIVGFLPILGFWMIPLGLAILAVDVPVVRRWKRKLEVWWHKKKRKKNAKPNS